MSANILEYSYDDNTHHLDDREALEAYKREKAAHPDAYIVLDDLDCGHWTVEVHESPQEKESVLRKSLATLVENFFSAFKK
jgi:hypothetical protein